MTGGRVGGDSLQLAHRLTVPRPAGGVQSEGPTATFALRPVGQLAHADVGVQPLGMTVGQPQPVLGELLICHEQADDILETGNVTSSVPPIATAMPLEP